MTPVDGASSIHAVVVAFLPEAQPFAELLSTLCPQVAAIHVIDNTPVSDVRVDGWLQELALPNVHLTRLGDNYGIAKALNVGLDAALRAGATHVLLSDQDSLPGADMVAGLLSAMLELESQGRRVAAVGPSFVDHVSTHAYRFQMRRPGRWFYSNQEPTEAMPHVLTLSLITSGSLLRAETIRALGSMREDFFIDYVDVEWSHRALAHGYELFGTRYASMSHYMGDRTLRVWAGGWRNLSEYSPLRLYYRVRNFVYMWRLGYVPLGWKIRASWFWLGESYAHVIFSRARLASFRMIMRGFWDGLRGRMGRYPDNQRTFGKP
ncbi:rhamnosyltransferase [Rhodanobacter glycinis]|uniref:Rhamnosyltransferase n=1 Tax=Rhodanobacter glycinis TaxID=582702 RepID=A0A5B9E0S4_9GAMM|nr:rhamnosyltransferase [Rhodanobacter glycinis]QEE23827.1 rhamnosyltransferase [Rhodanobacter glycinis]